MNNTPDSPAKPPDDRTDQSGNYWTLFTPGIWIVLHAVLHMMRFFRLTPPSVHQMVLTLEKAGLISRQPGAARSIAVLLDRSALPELNPGHDQSVKINVQRY
jgi:hypothetical protein